MPEFSFGPQIAYTLLALLAVLFVYFWYWPEINLYVAFIVGVFQKIKLVKVTVFGIIFILFRDNSLIELIGFNLAIFFIVGELYSAYKRKFR